MRGRNFLTRSVPPPGKSGGFRAPPLPRPGPCLSSGPQLIRPSQHFQAVYIVIPGSASLAAWLPPCPPPHLHTETVVVLPTPGPFISEHTNN